MHMFHSFEDDLIIALAHVLARRDALLNVVCDCAASDQALTDAVITMP